jgi:hypothetical protein
LSEIERGLALGLFFGGDPDGDGRPARMAISSIRNYLEFRFALGWHRKNGATGFAEREIRLIHYGNDEPGALSR